MQEQHDAANEELQVSSEEVQSANEEFQSVNEELETSKEELESANEELITVNEEMNHRNSELNVLNNDLINLQTSTKLAIVLLGRDLSIRRFSPQAEKMFDLLATDVGRPVGHIRHRLVSAPVSNGQRGEGNGSASQTLAMAPTDLEAIAAEVIVSEQEYDCDAQDQARNWYSLRVHPYKSNDGKVNGAVLVLVDITDRKHAAEIVAEYQSRFHQMIDALPVAVYVTDVQGCLTHFNRVAVQFSGQTPVLGVDKWYVNCKLFHPDGTPMAYDTSPMIHAIKGGKVTPGQTVIVERPDGTRVWGDVYPMMLRSNSGNIIGAINVVVDVTERRQLEESR
ncbi:MAG TPA: PAS domain-containing protein, partial [Candidatus Ozemobacteraceae bacterium]|nr:PAS domain-containing protein [Candidatus Ozemobacteraceae bacterium]